MRAASSTEEGVCEKRPLVEKEPLFESRSDNSKLEKRGAGVLRRNREHAIMSG